MREIKFRGKRIDNGEWVFGGFHEHKNVMLCIASEEEIKNNLKALILVDGMSDWNLPVPINVIEVDPKSVGQFTGLKDKNGKEIYEGDIVKSMIEDYSIMDDWDNNDPRWEQQLPTIEDNRDVVTLERFRFWLKNEEFGYEGEDIQNSDYYEIIGNIYDNPELLIKNIDKY
jgi:uncharacterized phage protein (TIGR01671 family)